MNAERVLIVAVGALFGASVLFDGFYDLATWGTVTVAMAAVLLALVIARPARPSGPALLGIGALAALWLFSVLSLLWAESANGALVGSSRWLLYASVVALLLLLLRDHRGRVLLLAAMGGGAALVAVYVTARMALDDGVSLFVDGRLSEPLGYINGQAGYLLMGFWPLVAVAERARRPAVAGAALGGAILVTSLAVMSQTRAILPAFALSVVVLVVVVPGRTHRILALVTISAGVLVISRVLLDVYSVRGSALPDDFPAALQNAGVSMLLSALVFGAAWAIVGSQLAFMTRWSSATRYLIGWRAIPIVALLAIATTGLVFSTSDPVERVKNEWTAFKSSSDSRADTRFLSGEGRRYDYWRVSLNDLKEKPVYGVGADNWTLSYYATRRTETATRQPHSLVFQTLAELGVVGFLFLLAFVVAVGWAFVALSRAPDVYENIGILVASGGVFLMWLAHTSVDWLHVLPGVTGMALCGAAVLLSPWMREVKAPVRSRALAAGGIALALLGGAVVAGRLALADRSRDQASELLAEDPVAALSKADSSLSLNGESVESLYLRSAAYAALDDYEDARGALIEAMEKEPDNFQPYEFLGDIERRRGNMPEAIRQYERAQELNPRSSGIASSLAAARSGS